MHNANLLLAMSAEWEASKKLYYDAMLKELTDSAVPLDERWEKYEVLCKKGVITEIKPWICHHADVFGERTSYYDDFGTERHQTVHYADMWEWIQEHLDGTAYQVNEKFTPERAAAWRELVLAAGAAGFIYDW